MVFYLNDPQIPPLKKRGWKRDLGIKFVPRRLKNKTNLGLANRVKTKMLMDLTREWRK